MSTVPLSIRFKASVLERLRRCAKAQGTTPSGLVQELVDEGLAMRETPGIVFRSGPSGRRAGLAAGPDVWEIVAAVKETAGNPGEKVASAGDELGLSESAVNLALSYYSRHPTEIEEEIAENERASGEAFAAWQARQTVLL
ncbi:MAG: hypothetical protein LBC97_05975 [Bifidobacteriaceae bacterium]|jgi:hypothetical protein|nr:hypothetical protein [Bifidobacteriaceae bacterium]